MAEVLVSSDDLTVLGGPAEIQLDLNVGAQGNRGVFVFFGLPNPNSPLATFSETPIVFDLYIIVDSSSDDYLAVFQYLVQDGVAQWVERIRLRTNFFGTNKVATFINGEAEIYINTQDLGLLTLLSLEDSRFLFNVQATLNNYDLLSSPSTHLPAALSVEVGDVFLDPADSVQKLPIKLHGAEFNGTSMQLIGSGGTGKSVSVSLSILVVSPTEVKDFIEAGA